MNVNAIAEPKKITAPERNETAPTKEKMPPKKPVTYFARLSTIAAIQMRRSSTSAATIPIVM